MNDEYRGKHEKFQTINGGKHIKNNPNIRKKTAAKVITYALVASILAGASGYVVTNSDKLFNSKIKYNNMDDRLSQEEMIQLLDSYIESNDSALGQLMANEMQWYINSTLSNDINNKKVKELLFLTIKDIYSKMGYTSINRIEMNDNVYNQIVSNNKLMGYINEYSQKYNVPAAVLVGLACENDTINTNDILNFGKWDNIDSTQTIYNFDTEKKEDLNEAKKYAHSNLASQVGYAAMAFRQSIKEANGVLYSENGKDAIDYYIDRHYNPDKLAKIQKEAHQEKRDRILNAMINYSNSNCVSISYNFDIANKYEGQSSEKSYNFIFDNYDDMLESTYDEIINYIIQNSNVKTK